ncbi:hypothetical protein BVX98_01235, partial [bacterium F11]
VMDYEEKLRSIEKTSERKKKKKELKPELDKTRPQILFEDFALEFSHEMTSQKMTNYSIQDLANYYETKKKGT